MKDLAINGGTPVRKESYQDNVIIDQEEKKLILKVLEDREFSGFVGSKSAEIDQLLKLSSIQSLKSPLTSQRNFLGGFMNRQFEHDIAKMFFVTYAVLVNSATSALVSALGAVNVEPGDEVICTCLSFTATASSIVAAHAVPVFVDISPNNFCMEIEAIEEKITCRTKAIMVVHLWGFTVDMDAIMTIAKKHSLKVIEDASQVIGAKSNGRFAGTIGDVGVFSFNEPKNIQTGEGGVAITNDEHIATRLRLIRNHGEVVTGDDWSKEQLSNIVGMNYRMTSLTAALGVGQLKKLDGINKRRQENTAYLNAELVSTKEHIKLPEFANEHVPHVYPLLYKGGQLGRDEIIKMLIAEGIPVSIGYPRLMYQNHLFLKRIAYGRKHFPWNNSDITYRNGDCPVAEEIMQGTILFGPIFPPNSFHDMDDFVSALNKILKYN